MPKPTPTLPARLAIQALRSKAGLWSVEATDTTTGATSVHRDVAPDSRMGRALEMLARAFPKAAPAAPPAPQRSPQRQRAHR